MKEISKKKIAVIYHADCPDGFGASYAAWKKFGGDNIEFISVFPQNDSEDRDFTGMDVYFFDICYSEDAIKKIKKVANSVNIIDHHKTNIDRVKLATKSLFSIDNSGAVLAWKFLFPEKAIPKFFEYIEDVDIWKFKLPNSREVSQAIESYKFDYAIWDKIVSDFENEDHRQKYILEGAAILRRADKIIDEVVRHSKEINFEGHKCLLANSACFRSFIGEALYKKMPPIGILWFTIGDMVHVSLRSDGTVDVSELAKKYGGGGHRGASGFTMKMSDFVSKIMKV